MIEEMKNQINHLIETFDYSNTEDYRDLLYIIYLNWIENNGENEEINTIINNFIKAIISNDNLNNNCNCNNNNNNCNCNNNNCEHNDNNYDNINSYDLYRFFLGGRLKGIPERYYGY